VVNTIIASEKRKEQGVAGGLGAIVWGPFAPGGDKEAFTGEEDSSFDT
jgi:hypothetical protein